MATAAEVPTSTIAIDSKFPLENYERMLADESSAAAFKIDVRKHIEDIARKYIIPSETGDGAVMFLPAEAVFAEIHAHHRDLVVHTSSRKITEQFQKIEKVEIEPVAVEAAPKPLLAVANPETQSAALT